jgi:putative ABC transport system ATP-binding protein
MTISLQQVIPHPIREKIISRHSDLWNRNVSIESSDFLSVVAPSGTGKTTLIHMLWHLRDDYSGQISYDGRAVCGLTDEELAVHRQTKASIVFQDLRLFAHLTAFENIELKRALLPKPYYEMQRIEEMAGTLGVLPVLKQRAGTCSYGEQQRIAIIRALMQPFDWLIMDEPFSHLDAANTRAAAALIEAECRSRGAGLLITELDDNQYFPYTQKLRL